MLLQGTHKKLDIHKVLVIVILFIKSFRLQKWVDPYEVTTHINMSLEITFPTLYTKPISRYCEERRYLAF
jgi:hypothetical protein